MKELSQAIGISRPTLSRYFQDPASVRPATSQKIKERLKDVDYVYNFLATRQNRKSTGLIGVIIPHFNDLFFTSLLEAIDVAARKKGFTIMTQCSHGNEDMEVTAVEKLRSMSADGAIIAPLGVDSSNAAFVAAGKDFPIVFADSHPSVPIDKADFVGTDNAQSIAAMVEYLCRAGDTPLFLGMPHMNSNAIEREEAYAKTMRDLGHVPAFVESGSATKTWDFEAYGHGVMDAHFSRQRHTAATILCANDRIAIGAIRAANRHGLYERGHEARGRLRIAGHDDHPLSQYMFPALTTMAQDIEGIGKVAIRLLSERVGSDERADPVRLMKEAALKLREST
ncbi:MAG: LacI family DNA-binding transcriptional regulator [Stappiaceae bacterium]